MNDRVHACLDGEIPREELSADERARLAALETTIEDAAMALRAAPAPDLTDAVMRALPAPQPARPSFAAAWERATAWLWSPRPVSFTFRPAYAFAGVAVALLGVAVLPQSAPETLPAVAVQAGETPELYVQFRLEAPDAQQVKLAGSFTEWQPAHDLHEIAPGVWSILIPLEPGVHDYTFVVDGEHWIPDPYAPQVDDSFGGANSRLFLPSPAGSA